MCPAQTPIGETTRSAIIDASFLLFVDQGYHGTSMREIAARAGITAGSIYNHFSDKEQIIKAVILKYHPFVRVFPRLTEVEGATAADLVRDAALRLTKEFERTPGILKLLFIELVELGGKQIPELSHLLFPEIQRFAARVYSTGEIQRPGDPITFFRAFMGMLMGYSISSLFIESIVDNPISKQSMQEFIETFLWGVLKTPVSRSPLEVENE